MQRHSLGLIKLVFVLIISLTVSACVTEKKIIGDKSKVASANDRANNSAERAVSYMNLKQLKTAEDILVEALKDSPRHSMVNYTYALLKLRTGEIKKADKFFRTSVNNDKNNSRAAHDYGFYLCSQKKPKDGIKMFELALSNPLFQQRALSYLRAGECIFKSDIDKAESYFLSAYSENNNLSIALFRLAELNFTRKDNLKARAFYQRYAGVQKDTAASLYLAYQIEDSLNSPKEAAIHRKNLLNKFPGSSEAKQVRKK